MKAIIRTIFFLLALSLMSCSDDDTSKKDIQTCVTEDLGITEEYRNPYPELLDDEINWPYTDWKWTMINDTVLRVKTTQFSGIGDASEYYYFVIDEKNRCLSFQIAKFRFPNDVEIPDDPNDGEVTYDDSSAYTLKLQYWSENEKFIGKIIPNFSDYPEVDQKIFWVELTPENHEPQTEWEEDQGL